MGAISLDELNKIAEPLLSGNKALALGPYLIALILDTLLCGVLLMQCGTYISLRMKDPLFLKVGVAYVMLMNLVITVYIWVWVFDMFVNNFGSYGLFLSIKYGSLIFVFDSMTVVVVQAFFARRAWILAKRNYFVLVIVLALMLTTFAAGIAVKIMLDKTSSLLETPFIRVPAYIWLFATVAADVIITATIITCLVRNKTGTRETDALIGRLWRIALESQFPPTLIAVGLAIEYTRQNSSLVSAVFLCIQAKFYGISLLYALNVRSKLKIGGTVISTNGDIEFSHRSRNKTWTSSQITTGEPSHATKGDPHRHTQLTIIPEPSRRSITVESHDSISFKHIELGDADDSRSQHDNRGVGKISEGDLGELGVDSDDDADERLRDGTARRSKRGGEFKLASMGMSGGGSMFGPGENGRGR